ncbi:MAG: hypothetical protein KMY53_09215 [Desulfarculus sp.]|nr:hypothetical protein [Pseudomonadota bacterium]MBV1716825.1 hypothetical protein [Desulfarculus sp.]MBU4573530.1 hypothetical protein [Pseudomonadota bacterium]MBU4598882.1 hypothetical protein [Pseudomonadota bacterium]MBV1738328.1 hypothetical protein [Desulfarculus sp.]
MTHSDQADRPWPWIIFGLPLALALVMVGIKIYAPAYYHAMIQEDGPLENVQFCCYAAAGLLSLWAALRFRTSGLAWHAGAALLLGLGFLLVAGDEISWGERILGYHLPQFFARYNVQREVSLHNLRPVQYCLHTMYMLAGLVLSLGWLVKDKLLARPGLSPLLRSLADGLVPPCALTLYFLPVFLIYSYFIWGDVLLAAIFGGENFAIGRVIVWRDQEPAELLLSMGCLLWAGRLLGQAVHRDQVLGLGPMVAVLGRGIEQPQE